MLAALAAPVAAITSGDFLFRTVDGDGGSGFQLPYRIYVPVACANRRCPLIVFLHGAGEQGSNNTAQLNNRANGAFQLPEAADAAGVPVIMAAPQAPQWWSNEGPTGGVADMIDDIQREFGFDPARVLVTGLSMGGGGTIGFLQRYDAVAAAAIPICPAGAITSDIDRDRFAPLPLWFFHAVNDGTVTVDNSRNSVATLRNGGGDPIYTEYATGNHNIWTQSYGNPRVVPWLLAQRWRAPLLQTDPFVDLTAPTAAPLLYTGAGSLSVAGSTGGAGSAVSEVLYGFGASTGAATGTASFAAGPLPVPPDAQTFLRVRATGSSFVGALGGNSTFSRTVRVVHPVPANRAPSAALWIEPVVRVGQPQRLRALIADDGQPAAMPSVLFEQIEGPASVSIEVDPIHDALAWWTPGTPGLYRFRVSAHDGAQTVSATAGVLVLPAAAGRPTALAVNVGGGAFSSVDGVDFVADTGFSGGTVETLSGLTTLAGTEDDGLYLSSRRGNTVGYGIDLANGRYLVVLHLAEWRWFTQVSRGMDVAIEDEPVLAALDLYRWAGLRQAMRMGFVVDVADGRLDLDYARTATDSGQARISAFEVLSLPEQSDLIFADGFQ